MRPGADALRAYRPYTEVHREFRLAEEYAIPYATFASHAKRVMDGFEREKSRVRQKLMALHQMQAALDGDGLDAAELVRNQVLVELAGEEFSPKTIGLLAKAVKDLRQSDVAVQAARVLQAKSDAAERLKQAARAAAAEHGGRIDAGQVADLIDRVMRGEVIRG